MVSRKREGFGLNVSRKREMVVSRKREDNSPESQRSVDNPQNGPQKRSKPLRGLAGREKVPRTRVRRSWAIPGAYLAFGAGRPFTRRREWRYRRHFWHDGSAVSTSSREPKSPHSVQTAPLGASWVGSSMWVFGFAIELGRLASAEAPPLLGLPESYWASRGEGSAGGIEGFEGRRTKTPLAVR